MGQRMLNSYFGSSLTLGTVTYATVLILAKYKNWIELQNAAKFALLLADQEIIQNNQQKLKHFF